MSDLEILLGIFIYGIIFFTVWDFYIEPRLFRD